MPGAATDSETAARLDMPTAPQHRRLARLALAGGIVLIVLILAGVAMSGNGKVANNVTLAGKRIGGLQRSALTTRVLALAARYEGANVTVRAKGGSVRLAASDIGLAVDAKSTVDAALAVGHGGNPIGRVWVWLRCQMGVRRASVKVRFDRRSVYDLVTQQDPGPHTAAVEPSLTSHNNRVTA